MLWVMAAVLIVAIIGVIVFKPGSHSQPVALGGLATSTGSTTVSEDMSVVNIMVPKNLPGYINAINDYISTGGSNPAATWEFVPETVSIGPTTDPVRVAAEAASGVVKSQVTGEQLDYLKVVNGTAYVVLKMDVNGWAGVSFAIAKAHPIVEKSLLAQPGITSVKFGYAPGDSMQSQAPASISPFTWKTFSDSNVGIQFDYPSYFGSVIITKTSRTSCPEMKTYLPSMYGNDYVITFAKNPSVGTGGSHMESSMGVIVNAPDAPICGVSPFDAAAILNTYSIGYKPITVSGFTSAYVSDVTTSIGTEAYQFYTLFDFATTTKMVTRVQPLISFIPYAYTHEANSGDSDIVAFVNSDDPSAIQIRSYLADYRKLVNSIKFTN